MNLSFAAVIGLALLTACSNPKDAVIPSDMAKWDSDLKGPVASLSEEERALLSGYLLQTRQARSHGAAPATGTVTIGEAIARQRARMEERQR